MVKYSIIIVSYNGEEYIEKCIRNIKKQNYKNYEIIFVDDGSTDNTEDKLKEFSSVKYFKIKHQGVSAARNYGISKASGEYFIFVDVDDLIENNLLEKIDLKTKDNPDLIKYGCKLVDSNGKLLDTYRNNSFDLISGEDAFEIFCKDKYPFDMICIYAYNRKFWNDNKFNFCLNRYHEDFALIPYVILKAKKIVNLNSALYIYVQSNESITRSNDIKKNIKKAYDILYHYDNLNKLVENLQISSETKKLFKSYISNAVILKAKELPKKELNNYIEEIKQRDILDDVLANTLIRKLKKTLMKLSLGLYIKVTK